ncbi:MAG: hypothetical protein ACLFUV_00370 [Methanomassiliicoccales archaeon]
MSGSLEEIASILDELGPSVPVAIDLRMDDYFDVVRALVDGYCGQRDLQCIYINSSIPAATISHALQVLEIDTERIRFIDCLSHMLMGDVTLGESVIYVEGPTMLESIVLKVEYFLRKVDHAQSLVVLDSVDSLSIHNDDKILSEFLQILLGGLRNRDVYPVVLTMSEQSRPEIQEMVRLVCDQMISLEENEEGEEQDE